VTSFADLFGGNYSNVNAKKAEPGAASEAADLQMELDSNSKDGSTPDAYSKKRKR